LGKEIKILTVESSPADLKSILNQLEKDNIQYSYLNVVTRDDIIKGLADYKPEIILSNYSLPAFDGFTLIELFKELSPHTPIIIVTGSNNEEIVVECMKKGADDYILKNNMIRLGFAVKRALENKQLRIEKELDVESLKESEEKFRSSFMLSSDAFYWATLEEGQILEINSSFEKTSGYTRNEIIGKTSLQIGLYHNPADRARMLSELKANGFVKNMELEAQKKNGEIITILLSINKILSNNKQYILGIIRDITDRKRAEESLRISEALLNTVIQTIPELIWLKDVDGVYRSCNKMFERFFGASEADIVGKTDYDFVNKADADSYREHDLLAIAAGKPTSNEESIIFADDGHHAIMDTIKTPVYDTQGTLIGVMGISRDITTRKQSENLLRESEEKYRILSELSPEMIYLVDLKGIVTYLNKSAAAQFRVNPSQIIGKHIEDVFPPAISRMNLEAIQKVINTKSPYYSEREIQFPFGKIWVSTRLSPVFNKEYDVVSVLGLSININEQKMAAKENLKLSRAVEQGPASVIITNREGDIEYVNKKFCDLTGYSKEEVLGKNPRFLGSGFQDKIFYKDLWDTILAGNNWSGELLNKKKSGELYWESALISPLINENGDIISFIAVKEDITENKNMESKLIEAKEKAESVNKLKDAFIANMSHEIRTPLNGILGMTSLIRDIFSGKINKDDEELFDGIDQSSKRIIRTVDLILNYSRLQVGEFPIFRKNISISLICENLVKEYAVPARLKSLDLKFQNDCGNVILFVDEYSTIIAISNLIDNAIKYTNKGFILVTLYKGFKGDIILIVKDSGIGISKEYIENIFAPYRQEQIGYGRAYEGIGLGLSLVKKVLTLNDANISVESNKGEGSTFIINFGKEVQSAKIIPEKNIMVNIPPSHAESEKALVLVVEDDSINQITIKRFFKNRYRCIVTDSSDEVIDILKKEKVDIILMDISILGDKNGLELTKELKALKEFSHIPIIVITAHAFDVDKQNALASGCDNFLAKPFSKQEILDLVDLYLHKS
jgi:PAS domain S-box-containing protein